jgi:hypothetical protein
MALLHFGTRFSMHGEDPGINVSRLFWFPHQILLFFNVRPTLNFFRPPPLRISERKMKEEKWRSELMMSST